MRVDPYLEREDRATEKFLRDEAKREGVPYSRWLERNGILSPRKKMAVARHEVLASLIDPVLLEMVVSERSLEAHQDKVPGGAVVGSILDTGKIGFKRDMPRRPRGRPARRKVHGGD